MAVQRLPLLFGVPADYRRTFVFEDTESGFKKRMVVHGQGIDMEGDEVEPVPDRVTSLILDWLEESIVLVRKELGQL